MATRKTRDLPGLAINHGAPLFVAKEERFKQLLAPLETAGSVTKYNGRVVKINGADYSKPLEPLALGGDGYTSSPDMNSMCEGLLQGVHTRFGTQVAGIERVGTEWVLSAKDGAELGRFEWCVVTSHTVGHPRWEQVFGYTPPLQTLAEQHPLLKPITSPLSSVSSDAIMVAMVAFKEEDAAAVMSLNFDVAHVTDHPVVSRIVRRVSGPYVSLCVHSTPEFAAKYQFVYGSTSAAAKLAADKWASDENKKQEKIVLEALMHEGSNVLRELSCSLPPPETHIFGPILHRWGSAFTYSEDAPTVEASLAFAVCGDFVGQSSANIYSGVEAAALSGIDLAANILSSHSRM